MGCHPCSFESFVMPCIIVWVRRNRKNRMKKVLINFQIVSLLNSNQMPVMIEAVKRVAKITDKSADQAFIFCKFIYLFFLIPTIR